MELFCGPGGLAVGAIGSKIKGNGHEYFISPVWANDIDRDTCETYSLNIKDTPLTENQGSVVCGDIRDLVGEFQNIDYNALAFGFPCNDFSMVGETKGFEGEYGPLYSYGVGAINAKDPVWFLAENVGGLRNANDGVAFETILHDLEKSGSHGYQLTTHLYRFEEYGVPQSRHRIIIVGIRNDIESVFQVPAPLITNKDDFVSCKFALENPILGANSLNNERTKQSKNVEDRLMCLPPGENAWFLDSVLKLSDDQLVDTMLGIQTFREHFPNVKSATSIREIIKRVKLNVRSARMSHIYRRLNPSRPSYTITGSGGGGTHVYHWSEPRALTNRERARIQTFDDDFFFVGSKESVRKQIGMAVPPVGAKVIFSAILKTLAGVDYDSVTPNLYKTGKRSVNIKTAVSK